MVHRLDGKEDCLFGCLEDWRTKGKAERRLALKVVSRIYVARVELLQYYKRRLQNMAKPVYN